MVQDAVSVAPHFYKVLLENDRVRVLGFDAKAGDKTEMHSHPAVVAYMSHGGGVKFTAPDGTAFEMEAKDGDAMYLDATTHAVEITGSSGLAGVLVELKD